MCDQNCQESGERDMKIPGGMNIQQMMKQAQKMQEDMAKTMAEIRVDATAGGGIVTVTMTGTKELLSIKIEPDAVKEGDIEMLEDLIVAAVNEANRKADEALQQKLGGMLPPGMNLPGLF
jgi:DNA-binding YbaB/EbfC family protein